MLLCAVILSSWLLRSSGLIIEGQHWGLFWFLFESFLKPRNTKNHVGSLYNFSSIPTCKLKIKWFTQRGNRFHYLLIFHVKGLKEIICKHFACCTTEPELASIKRSFDIEYTYNLLKKKKKKGNSPDKQGPLVSSDYPELLLAEQKKKKQLTSFNSYTQVLFHLPRLCLVLDFSGWFLPPLLLVLFGMRNVCWLFGQ